MATEDLKIHFPEKGMRRQLALELKRTRRALPALQAGVIPKGHFRIGQAKLSLENHTWEAAGSFVLMDWPAWLELGPHLAYLHLSHDYSYNSSQHNGFPVSSGACPASTATVPQNHFCASLEDLFISFSQLFPELYCFPGAPGPAGGLGHMERPNQKSRLLFPLFNNPRRRWLSAIRLPGAIKKKGLLAQGPHFQPTLGGE
jgi:hypothetical protein